MLRIPQSYPVYSRGYKDHLARIVPFLDSFQGLSAIGRYGAFKYNNQDHSILMGLLAADNILHGAGHDLWAVNTDYDCYQESATIEELSRAAYDESPNPVGPLVDRDLVLVLERQVDLVQAAQQALPAKFVQLERNRQPVGISNAARFQIDASVDSRHERPCGRRDRPPWRRPSGSATCRS